MSLLELFLFRYDFKIPCSNILKYLKWENIMILIYCSKSFYNGISILWKEGIYHKNSIFYFMKKLKREPLTLRDSCFRNYEILEFENITNLKLMEIENTLLNFMKITKDIYDIISLERKTIGINKTIFKTRKGETFTSIYNNSDYDKYMNKKWIQHIQISNHKKFSHSTFPSYNYDKNFFEKIKKVYPPFKGNENGFYDSMLELKNENNEILFQIGINHFISFLCIYPYYWEIENENSYFPYIKTKSDLENIIPFYKFAFCSLKPK